MKTIATREFLEILDTTSVRWEDGAKPSSFWHNNSSGVFLIIYEDGRIYRDTDSGGAVSNDEFLSHVIKDMELRKGRSDESGIEPTPPSEEMGVSDRSISVGNFADPLTVGRASVNYSQVADTQSEGDQTLTLHLETTGSGNYYVLETDRWAFDNPEELLMVVNDFVNRFK